MGQGWSPRGSDVTLSPQELPWPAAALGSGRGAGAKAILGAEGRGRRRKGGRAARTRCRAAALHEGRGSLALTDTSQAWQQPGKVGKAPEPVVSPLFPGAGALRGPRGEKGAPGFSWCLSPCPALYAHFGLVLTSAES